eukprot:1111699-Pleurochrysis_carterae.AAC.1
MCWGEGEAKGVVGEKSEVYAGAAGCSRALVEREEEELGVLVAPCRRRRARHVRGGGGAVAPLLLH